MAIKNPFCHERLKGRTKNKKISLPPTKTIVREIKNKKYTYKKVQVKSIQEKRIGLCLIFYMFNVICKKICFRNNENFVYCQEKKYTQDVKKCLFPLKY